jgi:putative endonuclease
MAFIYLLRCRDDSLYCGWTVDLDRRLRAHEGGTGARYTRSRLPVALAAAWETPDQGTARSLEYRVKRMQRPAKEELVAGAPLAGATRLCGPAAASA